MSDFDTVLERLLADPSFAATLAADPAAALAGYRLTPDEVSLLHSQVTGDAGGQTAVETRATQSSVFGLLGPLGGLVGEVAETLRPGAPVQPGLGQGVPAQQGFGQGVPAQQGFGQGVPAQQGFGPAAPVQHGFGAPPGDQGFGAASYQEGFGSTADPGPAGGLAALGDDLGRGIADARAEQADLAPPEGYRTRVDADGDGSWDRHTLRGTRDGGVDILVDTNADGRADFIGHDTDADGRVDSAEYDKDGDGFFEKRSYDDDGDGWLDRSQTQRPPAPADPPPAGGLIGRNIRIPDNG